MMSDPTTSLSPTLVALQQLITVVAKLRSPEGGCPWDLAQTSETLIPYIIEEAYEVVNAIQSGDQNAIIEELGDLLLQVILQSQVARDNDKFTLTEVATGISEKLIQRHPHVFGSVTVENVEEVRANWERIKATEKGESHQKSAQLSSKLSRYARTLPPLMAGMKISEKAASAGFEWDNVAGVWAKFDEELAEFKQALAYEDKNAQQAELGDLFFVLISLARWYNLDPATALQETNSKFIQRLAQVEVYADRPLTDYSLEELDVLWTKAKAQIAQQKQHS